MVFVYVGKYTLCPMDPENGGLEPSIHRDCWGIDPVEGLVLFGRRRVRNPRVRCGWIRSSGSEGSQPESNLEVEVLEVENSYFLEDDDNSLRKNGAETSSTNIKRKTNAGDLDFQD